MNGGTAQQIALLAPSVKRKFSIMIDKPWDKQIQEQPDELWTGDFSLLNLAETSSNNGVHLIQWYKTKNDLIDAMITKLNKQRE